MKEEDKVELYGGRNFTGTVSRDLREMLQGKSREIGEGRYRDSLTRFGRAVTGTVSRK